MSMTEEQRHERFKIAQENAWDYVVAYEDATTPYMRESCKDKAQTWAMIANALRRDHV